MTPRRTTRTVDQRWATALAELADALDRASYSPATVDRVVKHCRKFAAETGCGPWDADAATVAAWLDGLGATPRALSGYRTSLRTFYRWAYRAGRLFADPTADLDARAQRRTAPPSWHAALGSYRRYLQAAGQPASTVGLRVYHLTRCACEMGDLGPWEVSDEDLADWLAGHRWSRETARSVRSSLRGFYAWALALGHVDHNPAASLPSIRASAPRPHPAEDDAYRHALATSDRRTRLMLRLAAELGLRRAEVARLHSRDLRHDGTGWWLTVTGKGDKPRRLPLPESLAVELRALPAGPVFPGRDHGHLSPPRVGELVSAALPEGTSMHALRHRFASRAYAVDRDVFTVQRLLGHASPATTQRYVQTTDQTMRRLVALAAADEARHS